MTTLNPHNLLRMFIAAMRDCGYKPEDIKAALQSWAGMEIATPPNAPQDSLVGDAERPS